MNVNNEESTMFYECAADFDALEREEAREYYAKAHGAKSTNASSDHRGMTTGVGYT